MGFIYNTISNALRSFGLNDQQIPSLKQPETAVLYTLGQDVETAVPPEGASDGANDNPINSVQLQIDSLRAALDGILFLGAVANDRSPEAMAANGLALIAAGLATRDFGFGGIAIPPGHVHTDCAPDQLPSLAGPGFVIDVNGNRRSRFFSSISHEPDVRAPLDGADVETAFSGDLSHVQFPIEHRIMGDGLGSVTPWPPSFEPERLQLRTWTPEAYPFFTHLYVEAADKPHIFYSTIGSADHIDVTNNSDGDVASRTTRGLAMKVRDSYVGTIDNGWTLGSLTEMRGLVDGAQLVGHEVNGFDNGKDIGYVGYNSWGLRSNVTGAAYAHWIDYVAKSAGGTEYHDLAYALYGPFRIGTNYAGADFEEAGYEGAAITMKAGQGIYWNTSDGDVPDDYRWIPGVLGSVFSGYSETDRALKFVHDAASISIYEDGVALNGKLGFGVTPVTKPTVSGSLGGNQALASLCAALANLGLINDATS